MSTDASYRGGFRVLPRLALIVVVVVPNVVGAVVVLVLAGWVLPIGGDLDRPYALGVNLAAFAVYLLVAVPIGALWGWWRLRVPPGDPEQAAQRWRRLILRGPLRVTLVQAPLWAIAVVVFTALNTAFSGRLAVSVGFVVALGGATTCAVAYRFTERALRPEVERVFADRAPTGPALPGVLLRAIGSWTLGTGVPLVGIVLVGVAALLWSDWSRTRLAVVVIVIAGIALVVGLLVTVLGALSTAAPVLAVRRGLSRVEQGDYSTRVPVFDTSELGLLQAGFNTMVEGLAEREQVRDLFGRHVGEDVARRALAEGVELGGEVRDVAVVFVDLVGSTALAAQRPPEEVVSLLNDFFGVVVEVIDAHGGRINKFEGDAVLAVFGAPDHMEDPASCALAAGRALAERLASDLSHVRAGIGISAGRAVAGNLGGERRLEYTVIGDPVNEAARLTELAKGPEGPEGDEDPVAGDGAGRDGGDGSASDGAGPGRGRPDGDGRIGVLAAGRALDRVTTDEARHWVECGERTLRGRGEPTRLLAPRGAAQPV